MYLNRMNTIKVKDLPPYVNKTVSKSQSLYIIYNLNESFGGMTYLDANFNERIYRCAITTAEENEKLRAERIELDNRRRGLESDV